MRLLEINPRSQSIISSPLPPKSNSPTLPLVSEMRRNTLPLVPEMRWREERHEKGEREGHVRGEEKCKREDGEECQIVHHQDKPTSFTTIVQTANQVSRMRWGH